jgi:TldD protein
MDLSHREFLEEVLWYAKKEGAEYADCRLYPKTETEDIKVENGKIATLNSSLSGGFGVRLLVNGSWGFYATPIMRREKIREAVNYAIHSAHANALIQKEKVVLAPLSESWPKDKVVTYLTECEKDPSEISLEQKLMLLASADETMKQASDKICWRIAEFTSQKTQKLFASSDGVFLNQTVIETGASVQAHARGAIGEDTQRRSYPESHLFLAQGGYEMVQKLNLVQSAARMAEEAEQLLAAPKAPAGNRGIILLPEMLNLHIHETTHGFEADRVLGTEWTLAGGSFLTPLLPSIGSFQFGSPQVTLTADSLTEHGVGTFAYDDEGSPAQRVDLVRKGVWTGLLTSRETVPQLNKAIGKNYFRHSSSAMRASDYGSWPVIRMVNILLEPGEKDFEQLKDDVPDGTLMFGTNKSWSIDDVRRHFSFGTEIAWEKVRGTWELRKNAKYYGDNLHFWRNCQAVSSEKSFWLQGIGKCGKADPLQTIHTGHGSSPAYFTNIQVGSVA